MDLEREPNPKPAPEATGAIVEKKKLQVITAAAIGFGLLVAMLIGWIWMVIHRPAAPPQAAGPAANRMQQRRQTPDSRALDEAKEKAYEEARREGMRNNPAFNVNTGGTPDTGHVSTAALEAKPSNPKDTYNDLLAKAAVADSIVSGEKPASSAASMPEPQVAPYNSPAAAQQREEQTRSEAKLHSVGPNVIPAGWSIECSLVNELNGDNVGPVKVQVSNDVYYPWSSEVAIPQGSIFLGEAQRVSSEFQQRLAVTFYLLQLRRDGKLYEAALDHIPGLDQNGAAALSGKINNHYFQIFGTSLALGAIGGLAQIGNGSYGGIGGYDAGIEIRNGISQTMAQNASQALSRFLNRLPTITIPPGKRVVVWFPFGVDLS